MTVSLAVLIGEEPWKTMRRYFAEDELRSLQMYVRCAEYFLGRRFIVELNNCTCWIIRENLTGNDRRTLIKIFYQ